MQEISIKYYIGLKSYTKNYPLQNLDAINKQMQISLPLITGAQIKCNSQKKLRILVGEEINLHNLTWQHYQNKNINIHRLNQLASKGYERACLLNYKKSNQIVMGIKNDDYVVPDYLSLSKIINLIYQKRKID